MIQKRKVVTTIFEIGLPIFFALILIFIRPRVVGEMKENKVWDTCNEWRDLHSHLPTRIAYTPDNAATRRILGSLKHSLPTLQPGIVLRRKKTK